MPPSSLAQALCRMMGRSNKWTCCIGALSCGLSIPVMQAAEKLREPVPLELVAEGGSHLAWSSAFELSPDGKWLAYAQTGEVLPWDGEPYSKTGVPQPGGARTRVVVVEIKTGRAMPLGDVQ